MAKNKPPAPEFVPIPIEALIQPKDFKSFETLITMKNTTTAGELRKQGAIQIVEFLERGMVLEAPTRFCQKSHYLVLTFETDIPGQYEKYKFNTGARVESAEPTGDGRDTVTVSLIQTDNSEWDRFQSLFGNRQAEIEGFLRAAKGGE